MTNERTPLPAVPPPVKQSTSVESKTSTTMSVVWTKPTATHDNEITGYTIEYKQVLSGGGELTPTAGTWTDSSVTGGLDTEKHTVSGLCLSLVSALYYTKTYVLVLVLVTHSCGNNICN